MDVCQNCKTKPCLPEELLCASCFKEAQGQIASHYHVLSEKENDDKNQAFEAAWNHFLELNDHLEAEFDLDFVKKHSSYKDIVGFFKRYQTDTSNHGVGLLFIGDVDSKIRTLALATLRALVKKHFVKSSGIVSFDYATIDECISNVFGAPSDSLFATSPLLLIDNVDLLSIIDNKHTLRAFMEFIKYRLKYSRPSLMIINEPVSQMPKPLRSLLDKAFEGLRISI